jgi:hypothetical protein
MSRQLSTKAPTPPRLVLGFGNLGERAAGGPGAGRTSHDPCLAESAAIRRGPSRAPRVRRSPPYRWTPRGFEDRGLHHRAGSGQSPCRRSPPAPRPLTVGDATGLACVRLPARTSAGQPSRVRSVTCRITWPTTQRKVGGPHVHPLPVRERMIRKPGSGESSGDWGFPPQAPTPGIDTLPGLTRLNPRVRGLYPLARRGMARRHLIEWRSAFSPRAGYRFTSVEQRR